MKANRKTLWNNDDRAQVGIGTMIVFIATILVAATAAAVLVDTSGKLQERSSATGNEATKQVASNLILRGVYGDRDGNADIQSLNFTISLAPGASSMDLAQLKIKYADTENQADLDHQEVHTAANDHFVVTELRDPKNTMTAAVPVLSPGGLANIEVNLTKANAGAGMTLSTRESISVVMLPEVGAPVHADFISPPSFGGDDLVVLR